MVARVILQHKCVLEEFARTCALASSLFVLERVHWLSRREHQRPHEAGRAHGKYKLAAEQFSVTGSGDESGVFDLGIRDKHVYSHGFSVYTTIVCESL